MEIKADQIVFLIKHKGGSSPKINSVALELSIALTPEDAVARKAESFVLAIPAAHAEKVIASIQKALQSLRQSN